MRKVLIIVSLLFTASACDALQQIAGEAGNQALGPPSESEISKGLREALLVGAANAVQKTAHQDGFLGNDRIRIPFPKDAKKVASTLRDLGMGGLVDDFETHLNRTAEEAAKRAKPILTSAIKQMTLRDVKDIWRGPDDAATQYLRRTTSDQLRREFQPVIQKAMKKVELTRYWNPVINAYNKVPMTKSVNPDLEQYVMEETLDGLFTVIATEEKDIRENPQARVSAILQRVFGY